MTDDEVRRRRRMDEDAAERPSPHRDPTDEKPEYRDAAQVFRDVARVCRQMAEEFDAVARIADLSGPGPHQHALYLLACGPHIITSR